MITKALSLAFGMFWEILWPLVLGFVLSAGVQAFVSKRDMVRLLGDDSPRCIRLASLFGFASSSCSYAAAPQLVIPFLPKQATRGRTEQNNNRGRRSRGGGKYTG